MTSILVYGGYNKYQFYAEDLASALRQCYLLKSASLVQSQPRILIRTAFHYCPALDSSITQNIMSTVFQNSITHIINYNTNHLSLSLLNSLRSLNISLAFYSNDSLFSRSRRKYFYYKSFLNNIDHYDHLFFYRQYDLETTNYLYPHYCKSHKTSLLLPACPSGENINKIRQYCNKEYDFSFIGHYEPDGRLLLVQKLLALGHKLYIAGPSWPKIKHHNLTLVCKPLPYDQYLSCLGLAKVHIGFTSLLNRDIYTRRYFEIPFSRSVLLARFSTIYNSLSVDLSSVAWFYDHTPTVSEALAALIKYNDINFTSSFTEELEGFYQKNSINSRLKPILSFISA